MGDIDDLMNGAVEQSDASLEEAFDEAIAVIRCYQAEIRSGISDGRVAPGFCQGRVYLNAEARLNRMKEKKSE